MDLEAFGKELAERKEELMPDMQCGRAMSGGLPDQRGDPADARSDLNGGMLDSHGFVGPPRLRPIKAKSPA
jgi:hypothetical protein